jgi:hypothetical protein
LRATISEPNGAKSTEHRVERREQRAEGKELRIEGREQREESREERAESALRLLVPECSAPVLCLLLWCV